MACIELPTNGDSEMEEGEIVDEVDELSDISSEEEFLLRQRLQVLENYNNVLERKKAKKTNETSSGIRPRNEQIVVSDLSDVSETEFDDNKIQLHQKKLHKAKAVKPFKRKRQFKLPEKDVKKSKVYKNRNKQNKKKITNKVYIKSSDDSDDEYSYKRRKLADAVTLKKNKKDTSTLKDRINSMLYGIKKPCNIIEFKKTDTIPSKNKNKVVDVSIGDDNQTTRIVKSKISIQSSEVNQVDNSENFNNKSDNNASATELKTHEKNINKSQLNGSNETGAVPTKDSINLCTDNESSLEAVDSILPGNVDVNKEILNNKSGASSDEDIEMLREYALKTKSTKAKNETSNENNTVSTESKPTAGSDDEDSDTAELRLICLKSTLLKKAIEMKQKQKLRKRLSQSSCLQDDLMLQDEILNSVQSENNTDIESVDMDIGSDGEERLKENTNLLKLESKMGENINKENNLAHKEDELEEDEDLLRAKLLTSLSKNLPNLVDLSVFDSVKETKIEKKQDKETSVQMPEQEEKKFIIKLGDSDSEGEHEATKNLTKMHMKLAEHYQDFQSKLDILLKSTRKEFEKDTISDVVQKPVLQKPAPKFIPKAMNHLPKSEQIEYKNLVKRMAELEKIKQARNSLVSQNKTPVKETLKPRNTFNTLKSGSNLEEKIALSRKMIAEESAKVMKLKEEAKKLSQKYKIVATELKNISTAINLNKRQQRAVHSNLQQIRLHHQLLLKGSSHNVNAINSSKMPLLNKIQKENNPSLKETTHTNILKSVKVSIVNDVNKEVFGESRLSVQLDVTNNKKTIKLPKSPPRGRVVDIVPNNNAINLPEKNVNETDIRLPIEEKGGGNCEVKNMVDAYLEHTVGERTDTTIDDYKSPLAALGHTTWEADPNGFLCPYEVGGSCRDPDCKYLHPKVPSQ